MQINKHSYFSQNIKEQERHFSECLTWQLKLETNLHNFCFVKVEVLKINKQIFITIIMTLKEKKKGHSFSKSIFQNTGQSPLVSVSNQDQFVFKGEQFSKSR